MNLLVAISSFNCQKCGETIDKRTLYVIVEDLRLCLKCGLPERRLRPMNKEILTNSK